ncbi:DUF221-domain-containing protein [Trametes versicolor FP-101664 SS1]|uniref:DUF221-domain-containing protein n=1 Tax=Trametes versicolor (strain FP-101664) TaxID=717944 RepID=UPI000462297A|nr:DUF221-domain-containing protein [Trametes versicolor FP-101664 SS1]EIW54410.1 DUF221-domain-containing protein [Trametes versicolor FP-101664 SS1]
MSSSGDLYEIFGETASQRTLAPVAVASQVGLMLGVSLATVIVFNVLRPNNKIVYEPKVKYHVGNKAPPRPSDSFLGWVSPLLHTKEPELVDKIGLDAAIFLRFLRMCRWLFSAIAFLTCSVLIPINVVYNIKNVPSKNRDALSMLTIRDLEKSNWIFAHITVTYGITFIVMAFVWWNWREVVRLRRDWFRSPEYIQSFYARTLMVTDVPKKMMSDEGLRAIFESVQVPYPTTSVHIGRRVGRLPDLVEYHNNAVRDLEAVLVKYLKGGKIGKKRPTITIGGFMGCGGEKKDAIDFYTAKLQRAERAVEEFRAKIDLRKPENYGFASMAAVPYAHIVANMLRHKHPKGATITLAPNPKDIVWKNLACTPAEIRRKQTIGWVWLVAVCFFNTAPLLVISLLANLSSLTAYVPFLQSWSDASPGSFTFVSGVLPPAVSALFGWALPIIMRKLTKFMGANTHSRMDRAVLARYFAFLVISQLIVFTLIGVIFNAVKQVVELIGKHESFENIVKNFNKLPDSINKTYIEQASYWLTYFPLRGFLVVFDLAQIINLFVIFIKTHLFGRTPREIREWTQPPDFQYAIYFANLLFMGVVALFFAPLAPLVCVAAAVVFWISSWVYKYQLMFVFVSKTETGGRMWNVVINRLLAGVILMQCIMLLTTGLGFGFKTFKWISTIPPILIVLAFKMYLHRAFQTSFRYYLPTEQELQEAQVHSRRGDAAGNRLERRFGHPALNSDLFTPMVHANMTALLPQVYSGKIQNVQTKLDEMGGQKTDAQVVAGGIKIAAVEERDLEYDPALYRRDRGDDWDARSVSSSNLLADPKVPYAESGRGSPAPSKFAGYDRYLASGPQPEIEMTRLDTTSDVQPLLPHQQAPGYFDPGAASRSNIDLGAYDYSTPPLSDNAGTPLVPAAYPNDAYREAPLHRPYPTQTYSSNYSPQSQYPPQQYPQQQYSPQQQYPPQQYSPQPQYQGQSRMTPSPQLRSPDSYFGQPPAAPPGLNDGGDGNMAGRGAHRLV